MRRNFSGQFGVAWISKNHVFQLYFWWILQGLSQGFKTKNKKNQMKKALANRTWHFHFLWSEKETWRIGTNGEKLFPWWHSTFAFAKRDKYSTSISKDITHKNCNKRKTKRLCFFIKTLLLTFFVFSDDFYAFEWGSNARASASKKHCSSPILLLLLILETSTLNFYVYLLQSTATKKDFPKFGESRLLSFRESLTKFLCSLFTP